MMQARLSIFYPELKNFSQLPPLNLNPATDTLSAGVADMRVERLDVIRREAGAWAWGRLDLCG